MGKNARLIYVFFSHTAERLLSKISTTTKKKKIIKKSRGVVEKDNAKKILGQVEKVAERAREGRGIHSLGQQTVGGHGGKCGAGVIRGPEHCGNSGFRQNPQAVETQ